MKNREGKKNWLLQRAMDYTRHRFKSFRLNEKVRNQSFVRLGPKRIECVDANHVINMARNMEATIVMVEDMEGSQPVVLSTTNIELAHFVAYVRELDDLYRKQADKVVRLERERAELLKQQEKAR